MFVYITSLYVFMYMYLCMYFILTCGCLGVRNICRVSIIFKSSLSVINCCNDVFNIFTVHAAFSTSTFSVSLVLSSRFISSVFSYSLGRQLTYYNDHDFCYCHRLGFFACSWTRCPLKYFSFRVFIFLGDLSPICIVPLR